MGPESAINLAKPREYVWAERMVLFQLNVMISRIFKNVPTNMRPGKFQNVLIRNDDFRIN